ncbi:hypothetical protein BX286_0333 [Streptomyces sp. 3211.6]|uniref:DUF6381 family protein n=1 Tax=Streptomyces TaxID=1883 RepID=UPI0009A4EFC4|nr:MULTISPECIES: DUF6381 family protein [Streptomyces]RKT02432.1 hypothetical protein BX286_0333 [Streptomyces sp. 3211.6]RPF43748.1 hypothetical protein EDD96_0257 [Streptomyces sp. Ag109_G2-6]
MSSESRPDEQVRHIREKAEELERAAQRSTDPDERRRLTDKALHIRQKLEELHGPESATMDPM